MTGQRGAELFVASELPGPGEAVTVFLPFMSNASPYRTIAVASTFSPRFLQVLAEAKRIGDRFCSDLQLIYVGEETEEVAARFRDVLAELSLPAKSVIHYGQGDPASGILQVLNEHKIDMIVAGALEKELALHQFLGNVARRLVREASCSVMLFTRPEVEPRPLRKIVFVADYSDPGVEALKKTFQFAAAEKSESVFVIRVITSFDQARASLQISGQGKVKSSSDEETELEEFVLSAGHTEVPVEARCIRGNTGFAAADFVQSIEADLLVVPVPPSSDQSLPSNVAWITDVIPCNLWVIR
jgi:nucleotide-binding universal stress UspA family protein